MYKHILIATDGSELASKAVAEGLGLASACKARATVLTVSAPFSSLGDAQHMFAGLPEAMRRQAINYLYEEAKTTLKQAQNAAKSAGVDCAVKSVEDAHPFQPITMVAEQDNCDLIVMASHGRSGASRLLLGSETTKVLTHSKIPVLVCR